VLSIRAGFAVRFNPLRWERGDQPRRHGLALAFEVKLAAPPVMDRIFKTIFFYERSHIAGPRELSIRIVFDENSNAAPADVGVVAVGTGAKDSLWRRSWGSARRAIVFRHADQEP